MFKFILAATVSAASINAQVDSPLRARNSADHRVLLDVIARPGIMSVMDAVIVDNGIRIDPKDVQLLSPNETVGSQSQLVLVIDAINSSFQEMTRSEEAVENFLRVKKGELTRQTSIVVLSDIAPESTTQSKVFPKDTKALRQRQLFAHKISATKDANALIDALKKYKVGLHRILESQTGVGQGERVQLWLQALSFLANGMSAEPGPKVVVWIGPGWPFLAQSEAKSSAEIFDSVIYFSNLLRSARMILYSVDPRGVTSQDNSAETEAFLLSSRPSSIRANGHASSVPIELSDTYYTNFLNGVRSANDSNPNDLALQVLAYQSGGLVLQHNNDLKAQINECAVDADRVVSIAYAPVSTGSGETHHEVEVKSNGGLQTLRTRKGFYWR